jgi:hypothetical protein
VECTHYLDSYVVEQLGCARLALTPAIRRWSKHAQLKHGCLFVVCPRFVIGDEAPILCCDLDYHFLLRLVLCPIQFHRICGSSGTHRCYHRSDELSLFVVVRQVPPHVRYTPWPVRYSFWGASLVVIEDVLCFVVVKSSGLTSCLIRAAVFVYYWSCLIPSAVSEIRISYPRDSVAFTPVQIAYSWSWLAE